MIQKLYDRKYAEGNDLIPTPSGIAVAEALTKHAQIVTDSKMTAHLEADMDDIANGKSSLDDVVSESQNMLSDILDTMEQHRSQIGDEIRKAIEAQRYIGKCPACGGELKAIRTRFGRSFVGCSNYPTCKRTFPMPPGALVQPTDQICEQCKSPMVKVIRRGQPVLVHCLDPDCETNRSRTAVGKCPKCGKELRLIYSKNGKRFLGCSGYPACDRTYPLPQLGYLSGTGETCQECNAPILLIKMKGRSWSFCANIECPSKKRKKSSTVATAKEKKARTTTSKKSGPKKKASGTTKKKVAKSSTKAPEDQGPGPA